MYVFGLFNNMSFESLKYIISQKSYVAGLFLYLLLLFNFFLEQFAFVVNSPKIQILIYSNLHKIDCTLFLFIFFITFINTSHFNKHFALLNE